MAQFAILNSGLRHEGPGDIQEGYDSHVAVIEAKGDNSGVTFHTTNIRFEAITMTLMRKLNCPDVN